MSIQEEKTAKARGEYKHSDPIAVKAVYDLLVTKLEVRNGRVIFAKGWDDAKVVTAVQKMSDWYVNPSCSRSIRKKYFGFNGQSGANGLHAYKLAGYEDDQPTAKTAKTVAVAPAPQNGFRSLPQRLDDLEAALVRLGQPDDLSDVRSAVGALTSQVEDLKARLDYLEQALGGK